MSKEIMNIDPETIPDKMDKVEKAFERWYREEWFFVTEEEFRSYSCASFLSYVKRMLKLADEEGIIDLENSRETLYNVEMAY